MIQIKRVYDPSSREDGKRVLIDRLWPRGLTKEQANVDVWLKEVAPSTELRQWFGHDPAKWPEFQARYKQELKTNEALALLRKELGRGPITLLYGAKDEEHNNAVVLKDILS